ncbi:MAG: 4-(cytidine 5'-diphospho)-2-C-methyl-D-erythritol kinase [Chloroflexota bacterium]
MRVAPAKVNLTLAVTGRTADGFHTLHTVMVPLGLSDRLSVARAHGPTDTLAVTGLDAGPNEANLVVRAIAGARAALRGQVDAWPVAARLHKHIPVAAGLGGGSSDAAAALDAVFSAWGADMAVDRPVLAGIRAELAERLGSDVPFFLTEGPAITTGRGEVVDPLPGLRGAAPGLLLVTPRVPAPTPAVFRAFDEDPEARPRDSGSTRLASQHLAGEWHAGMHADALVIRAGVLASANDLAAAADVVVPGLRSLRRALVRRLARPVGLSGSGPTLWVLYASRDEARSAAEAVMAGLADGSIVAPGPDQPSIIATELATATGDQPREEPSI